MTAHAPTIACAGIDGLGIDVQVASGWPAFTIVRPIMPQYLTAGRRDTPWLY